MASNYTTNFGLCQWAATDQVKRTEFNADNAKIDAALAKTCQPYIISYTGDGNPCFVNSDPWRGHGTLHLQFSGRAQFRHLMGREQLYLGHWQ